ncbi:MAG: hypothetical protein GXO34_03485, partial [Deltaproteobacteria bacterium]|nr:hypothetical protein [Deltaproteobacteria bacterium]
MGDQRLLDLLEPLFHLDVETAEKLLELLQDSESVGDWLQPGQVAESAAWDRREAAVGRALMAGMAIL